MWENTVGIRHIGCPVSDTSAAHRDVHIQNLSKVGGDDETSKRLLGLQGDSRAIASVQQTADGSEHYVSTELQFAPDNPSVNRLVSQQRCHRFPTVNVRNGIEHWILYTESKATVIDLIERLEDHGNEAELIRCVDIAESNTGIDEFPTLFTKLTDRQRATFEAALRAGYYEDDSDVTVEEIAETLGVHPTTSWEHLSKAENQILRAIGERLLGYADDPELAPRS
jgi:predicted DNA binding protein